MKLKEGFLLHDVGDEHMVIATGEAAKVFNGLIRNNATASFLYRHLMTETTEEALVEAMMEQYDAPRERIEKDVHRFLEQLRELGFLDG